MPYGYYKKNRSSIKKKQWKTPYYKKKYTNKYKNATMVKMPGTNIIADSVMVKLPYCDQYTMTSTSGTVATQQFRQNGIFDPDVTYTGHQPRGFDEYATLYDRYVVYGVAVEVDVVGVTSGVPGVLSLRGSPNSTLPSSDIYEAVENPRVKYIAISGSEGQNRGKLSTYFSTKALAGVKDLGQERDYRSVVTTNPTEQNYINICWQALNGSSTTACNAIIKLTYYVKFFDRKTLGSS